MGNRRGLLTLGILCTLTAVVYADKCRSGCQGASSGFFKYEEGASYKYKLDGATVTTVAGAQGDVSKVTITADVQVSVAPQCSYVLKVANVQVNGPDGKAYNGLGDLEAHPVKFSLNDGRIENEVCSEEGDSHEALNIKRAIISLFQASVHKDSGVTTHYETDVFGVCPTDFEFSKSGNSHRIKKTRNLNQCAHREILNFPVISASYSLNSAFQSSPILSSSLKVEQQIKDGVLESAVSDEKYYYQPHLSIDSGATVAVKTKLTFVSKAKGAISAAANKPSTLIFSAPLHSDPSCSADTIQKALAAAESSTEPHIRPSAASDFANLVEVISRANKADIVSVYNAAKGKETSKKLLLDAITRASNGDAVEVMAELVKGNELSELQKGFWILNLGFVKHVTKASLKAVIPLLDNAPHIAYLGIGSFAGRFCNLHDCQNVPEFKELLSKLAAPVFAGCKVDSIENENKLIASLKGLHNVHHLTDEVAGKLAACAQDKSVKTRIRVAALEAFQSDASKSKIREASIAILKDLSEDSEIRIKAYLSLVECPCNKVADVIKNVLDNEKSNQVGSFIVSHLRNVRASTNPDKAHAKHFLGAIHTGNKFPIDVRRFSTNHELSYSLDAVNVGTAAEANVIFSEQSFVPRSVNLNLTTQVFGHAFNLFEVNARSENIDYLLEKYFGPKGYFPTHNPHDIFDTVAKTSKSLADKIKERYENTIRPKRSIQEQTSAFAKNVVVGGVDSHDKNLDIDLSLKMFGAEVGWYTYTGSSKKFDMSFIDNIFNKVDSSLDKAKNFDIDYKKHATFLDAEAIYPTGLGFPLKVSTRGSSAMRLKVDGKFDLPAMLKDPKNANLDFELIPSAAIELSGQLTFDAYVVESGARIAGNIHSATGSSVSVRLLEGRGVDVKFGLPVKKQEVVNFKSHYHTVSRERGHMRVETPIKFSARKQEYKGCFDQLEELIGLTFCGDVSFPWDGKKALSPAYGTTTLSARIEKDDDSLTTYHFKAYLNNKDPNKAEFEILLDTPNSKTNRKISFNLDLAQAPNKRLSAVLTSPWKALSLEGQITNTDKEGSVFVKIVHDGTEYYAKAGVNIDGDENHKTLKPMLEYKAPEFEMKKKGLIGFKGGKADKGQKAVAVEGIIKLDKDPASGKRTYTLQSVKVSTGRNQFVFDGTLVHDDTHLDTDLKVSADKEVYKIVSKLAKTISATEKAGSAYIEFTPTQSPDLGLVVDWKGKKTPYTVENDLTVVHGHDPKSTESKITIHQFVKFCFEKEKPFEFATKNSVSYPLVGLSGAIEAEAVRNKVSYLLDGTYGKQQVSSSLNA
ncbi:apolipophorins-like, partial [Nilaparvata lugens]|uniref:apolipophorins-like n=1 Tax=Nilaparvata lugens TaxID=108931 RepID=UPI00193CC9BE